MTAKKVTPDNKEVVMAILRVGMSYRELAQWLLDLSQINFDDLSQGDMTNLEWEAMAFFQFHHSLRKTDNPHIEIEKFVPDDPPDKELAQYVRLNFSNENLLNSYHHIICNMLENLANGIPVVIEQTLSFSMEIEDGKLVGKSDFKDETSDNLLELSVFDLFRKTQSQFKLCEECEMPFMAIKRQKYCSTSCSQAMRTRKFQAKRKKNM
jgi:hypothetical protein